MPETIASVMAKYHAETDAEFLIAAALGYDKDGVVRNYNQELPAETVGKISQWIARKKNGEPAAYIVGWRDFFGLRFTVSTDTLIPRPESEWLVEETLKFVANKPNAVIADIGTGSGCLAISVAKFSPVPVQVIGVDQSPEALAVAKQNSVPMQANVDWRQGDLLEPVSELCDVIMANLPYVPYSDYIKLQEGLRFEPQTALTDNTDDFVLIKRFLEQLPKHLKLNGMAILETDPASFLTLSPILQRLIEEHQWTVEWRKDIQQLHRYIVIKNETA